jgi:hypothetical protein
VVPVVPAVVLAVVPDVVAAVPLDPLGEPLVAAVEPELAGSLDPPPPHAANASTTEYIE